MRPDACPPLPEADFPYVVDGTLTWGWESDVCSVLVPSAMPVHIHLDPVERDVAGWLLMTVEPHEILIAPQDQWDVTDDDIDPNGSYRAREEFPVRVTISLVGEPSQAALDGLAKRGGLAFVGLRTTADATDTFPALHTYDQFMFYAGTDLSDEDGRDVPMISPVLLLALLGLGVALRRRA